MKTKLIVGASGIITAFAVAGALAFGNVKAANHGNYVNQERAVNIEDDVTALTQNNKGIFETDADGDGISDIYADFGSFKEALALTAEQVDANTTNIASEGDIYDKSKTYKKGALCIRNGVIYQCTEEIAGAEEWTDSHWKKVSVAESITEMNSNLGGLSFAQDANGNWGYRKPGADSVVPFTIDFTKAKVIQCLDCTSQYMDNNTGTLSYNETYTANYDGMLCVVTAHAFGGSANTQRITSIVKINGANIPKINYSGGVLTTAIYLYNVQNGDVINVECSITNTTFRYQRLGIYAGIVRFD